MGGGVGYLAEVAVIRMPVRQGGCLTSFVGPRCLMLLFFVIVVVVFVFELGY